MGFRYYNTIEPSPTRDILAELTSAQKLAILDGFAENSRVNKVRREHNIDAYAIKYLYKKLKEVEDYCISLFKQEILLEEATYDEETGEELTPRIYNDKPTSKTNLTNTLKVVFNKDFTATQVTAIVNKIILYSKSTKNGDWTFYSTNVK